MANIEEILGRQINSVKELKSAISDLQNSLIGVDTESEEFKTTSMQLAAAQEELTKVTRAGKEENVAATDSLVGMQQEYKKLYDQYKMLTEEQRNSDFGKNMAASLDNLSAKMNEVKQGAGNFKDNIGRYADDIGKAFDKAGVSIASLQGPLKTANAGFKSLNATMKANPIGLVIAAITALIAIFKKVKDAVGANEELQMRYNEAMAKFQPIVDTAKNALDFLAGALVKTIEFVAKAVQKIREFGAAVTDFFGITKGKKKELQEQQKVYDDIAKSTNQLTKNKREYQKLNANDKAEVERLREAASATEDRAEKIKLLEEAKNKQAEIDARNLELAKEELRILEEQATLTANDAEMNDKLAAATARVAEAEAAAAKNARDFNKQISAAGGSASKGSSSMKGLTKATKDYREEAKKLYEETLENSKTELQKLTEKYEKEKKLLEKYHYDTTLLTKQYNKDMEKILKEQNDKVREKLLQGYRQRREDLENEWENARKSGNEELAIAGQVEYLEKKVIPQVKAFKEKVENTITSLFDKALYQEILPVSGFNAAVEAAQKAEKELQEIIYNNGFEALSDDYKELKEGAEDLNSKFGLNITTLHNLSTTLEGLGIDLKNLKKEFNEIVANKAGEEAIKRITNSLRDANINLFNELLSIDPSTMSYEGIKEYMIEGEYIILEEQKKLYEQELALFKGTQDQKLQLLQQYYATVEELENRERELYQLNIERTAEMVDSLITATDSIGSALGNVKSSYETLIDSELKAGKIDEDQARKKKKRLLDLEKVQTAFSIATIVADAAAGIFSVWKGYAYETGTVNPQTAAAAGPAGAGILAALNTKSLVTAIAKTTSLAATATAQIMAARNGVIASSNNFAAESGGGSTTTVGATPNLIDSSPYSYTRTVQTQEEEDALNQPVWVSVVDVENALGHRVVVKDESSF